RVLKKRHMREKSLTELTRVGAGAAERAGLNLTGAATSAGNWGTRGAEGGADLRTRAARDVGALGTESAVMQGRNVLGAETAATQDRIDAAHARATGQVAQGTIRSNMCGPLVTTS